MSEVKNAKIKLKKAKRSLAKAEIYYFKANKHGSEKQIALCKKRLDNAKKRFIVATEKLETARQANPNFINKTVKSIAESPIKKVFSWTGLAVTTVVTTVAGVILYDYLNNDEENKEATDSV